MEWKRLLSGLAALMLLLGVAGCNTMEGVGEDVEAAGGALDKKAEEHKGY